MANIQKPLGYVCRGCRLSFPRTSSYVRGFSSTRSRQKTLVEFRPTSSPELDAILDQYRETLFIPSVLSETHRRLIYRPSKAGALRNEPGVTVTLPNDQDIKLQPMRLTDRPIKKKTLPVIQKHLAATKENEAWTNLIPFLEGMKVAKEPLPEAFLEAVTRIAYEQGQYNIPLRCAQIARRTNYRLCNQRLARAVFLGCHIRAATAGFQGDELDLAAKQAELFSELLEREEHCGGTLRLDQVDTRQDLMVVGVLLELAAAKAVSTSAGKDVDGQVANYVAKTLTMSEGKVVGLTPPSSAKPDHLSEKQWRREIIHGPANYLLQWLPLWHGMKLAFNVEAAISPETRNAMEEKFKFVDQNIKVAESECRKGEFPSTRALQMYDQLQSL